jgi:hypothetical protein
VFAGDVSFTLREAYSQIKPDVPGEFNYSPAVVHIHNTETLDFSPGEVWKVVAKDFK